MKTIAEFTDKKGFNVKLTDDKVFVSSIGNEETFALRSVNGVGLYDDIKKYNNEVEAQKKKYPKWSVYFSLIFGLLYFIICLQYFDPILAFLILIFFGFIAFWINNKSNQIKNIKLDSYFRLMLSGGSREFQFDKSEENSVEIADFINKLEDTLTSYK
ncbi:hypothetical protein OAD44_00870 [Flavobacteriaceae bacterium]|nr:hypothetical protein [Flavobacteriaceae bacterium]